MNENYSRPMKKLMRKQSSVFALLFFIVCFLMLLGLAGYDYITEKSKYKAAKENTELFDPFNEDMEYGQITPTFMSEKFAAYYDDSIYYCFIIDEQNYAYIVAVNADQMDKYEDLIEYTYYDVEKPESFTLKGESVEIESELIDFAVDSYNVFMGTDNVNENNISDHLGYYYLDTTQQLKRDYTRTIIYLVLAGAMAIVYFSGRSHSNKSSKRTKETKVTYGERILEEVDNEINQVDTIYFKKEKVYITKNYIVFSYNGFQIIPISDVIHIYATSKAGKNISDDLYLVIETQDGVHHEVLCMSYAHKFNKIKDQVVEVIQRSKPEVEIGFDGEFLETTSGFKSIEVDTKEDFSDVTSNVFLGIIGAILGAAIGGIAWILIGKLGVIAGIAGYLMMYFAIIGYRKLSGFLDKKGQIISLLIALSMIFFVNYFSYVLDYCKYYMYGSYSIGNIVKAFSKIPNLLTETDGWRAFILNLVIGYALSIWSGYHILRSVFRKNK